MVHAKIEPSAAETTRRARMPVLHRYTVPVVGLDPAHDGLRIAHVSDFHVGHLMTPDRAIEVLGYRRFATEKEAEAHALKYVTYNLTNFGIRYLGTEFFPDY